ncbi:hypothetical protein KHM83_02860 [Fusibacter paucivorans]|uniref:Hook-length control protein FliK n=1 Tax=Fusibacter paucivorans TaxID=76009 RepID=A0ABS5PKQ7_9FIRM|nr:hypothetical protein [Fusibacter paucivorans]MBS7525611.1 hypothetical protein [Fusibacter paucivorans]
MKISQFFSSLTQPQSVLAPKQDDRVTTGSERTLETQSSVRDNKIAKLLSRYNVTASEDDLDEINHFMDKASGTEAQKLNTLETALAKGIEPTDSNLSDLHSALNDAALTAEQIDTLAVPKEATAADTKAVIASLKLPKAIKAVLSEMVDQGYTLKEATAMLANALGISMPADGSAMKALMKAMSKLSVESVANALSTLGLENSAVSTTETAADLIAEIRLDTIAKTETPDIASADSLAGSKAEGDLLSNREVQPQTKMSADQTGAKASDDPKDDSMVYEENAVWHNDDNAVVPEGFEAMVMEAVNAVAANLESLTGELAVKQYLVTETTAMGIEMKAQFDAFKSEVTETLAAPEAQTAEALASSVAKAIEMIDKTITQKEVTLYSTMQTERDLLLTSSELREASNLLAEGKISDAVEIVSKAHDTVKNLFFNPDRRQVMLFVTQRAESAKQVLEPGSVQSSQKIQTILSQLQDDQGRHHARDVVETLRFMGSNHESEVVSSLEGRDHQNDHELIRTNVKEILLKMAKEDSEQRTVSSTEKSLMNLAGQQMMNDQQQNGKRPFYFFNYPISEANDVGEMKVYVTGQNRQSQVDWQNSELYFGMDLGNIGKTGIKISIQNGDVSIQVLNDQHEALTAVLETYKEDMTAAGFKQVSVQGTPYEDKKPNAVVETQTAVAEQVIQDGKVDMKV